MLFLYAGSFLCYSRLPLLSCPHLPSPPALHDLPPRYPLRSRAATQMRCYARSAYILYPPSLLCACSALQTPRALSLPGPASSVSFFKLRILAPLLSSSSCTLLATWLACSPLTQMTLSRPLT